MNLLKSAAIKWYLAEYPDREPHPMLGPWSDIYAVAIPRVLLVWKGEVRWSEASPGDRAVWKGRARDVELVNGRLLDSYWNVYDTVQIHRDLPYRSWNLFGNTNIGNYPLTNMFVAGQMGGDRWARVHQLYCVLDRDLTPQDDVIVDFILGCSPRWMGPLREAVRGVPLGLVIPTRQNFSVRLHFGSKMEPLTVVAHLEGVESYGGSY